MIDLRSCSIWKSLYALHGSAQLHVAYLSFISLIYLLYSLLSNETSFVCLSFSVFNLVSRFWFAFLVFFTCAA